jgi:hypothetical protein
VFGYATSQCGEVNLDVAIKKRIPEEAVAGQYLSGFGGITVEVLENCRADPQAFRFQQSGLG